MPKTMTSDPNDDPGPEAPEASSSAQPNRMRRRPRKRQGPPQLQFLTATDPSQFKDETAKRSVRSQAMIQYRYRADQQKRRGKEAADVRPVQRPPIAERKSPVAQDPVPYSAPEHVLMKQVLSEQQEQQHLYPSTSAAWWGTNTKRESSSSPTQPALTPNDPAASRYHHALSIRPRNALPEKVHEYEESEAHENAQMRILVAKLATVVHIDDGVDPFEVIPKFANKDLDALYLVRSCNRAFVSPATLVKWLPSMLAHPHLLLSSTLLASTWIDMHAGCSGDSRRTVLVKGEVIGYINARLRNPVTQFEDFTLMVILHLLAGEMWSCNEKTLRIHESGVARLITHRGGMGCLGGNGAMAEVAAATCLHSDIFCEATPLPVFRNWDPPIQDRLENTAAIAESPLYCPRSEFFSIARDARCSEWTYELISDMRDLTDLFLAYNEGLDTVQDVDSKEDASKMGSSLLDYDAKIANIRARLAALPSAFTPGLPVTEDWVFESCRIAAIIYASSIIMRVPFSVASEPGRSVILADAASLTNSPAVGHLISVRLTEALYEALEKSNTEDVWGDMAGVHYWVSLVGAAAARTPAAINMSPTPKSRSEAYTAWVRRCLIMFATRTMIILVFQQPLPVIIAQKRMQKIQELVGTGDSRRLVS